MSLGQLENDITSVIPTHVYTNSEKLVKIDPEHSEKFSGYANFFVQK